jgi:hypothetical protein
MKKWLNVNGTRMLTPLIKKRCLRYPLFFYVVQSKAKQSKAKQSKANKQ